MTTSAYDHAFQTIDGQADVFFAEASPQTEHHPQPRAMEEPRRAPPPPQHPGSFDRSIMSSHTSAAVDSKPNGVVMGEVMR